MRTAAARRTPVKKVPPRRKQVNVRVEPALYQALETVARQERRSVPQAARQLLEEGLQQYVSGRRPMEDTGAREIAGLAARGGAFDWLADEPELYDDRSGQPV